MQHWWQAWDTVSSTISTRTNGRKARTASGVNGAAATSAAATAGAEAMTKDRRREHPAVECRLTPAPFSSSPRWPILGFASARAWRETGVLMSLPDYNKPDEVDTETWRQHLEWMKVMESSRRHARPLKKLMDDYFVPPKDPKQD